jgi:signal transduction histidine kinase
MDDTELAFFLDRLVHDLREPLRSVTAFSEVLKEQAPGNSAGENEKVIGEILEGGQRIRTITDALSRFSLALEMPSGTARCSLRLATDMAALQLDGEFRLAEATLECGDLSMDVPVRLERMTDVMVALLSNAVRFHGEAPPLIRVSAKEGPDGSVTVSVEDNGVGIAPGDREKVFLPFMRVYGRKFPGAGLGLTIARRIAENHGGSLQAAECKGTGAVFQLILPSVRS